MSEKERKAAEARKKEMEELLVKKEADTLFQRNEAEKQRRREENEKGLQKFHVQQIVSDQGDKYIITAVCNLIMLGLWDNYAKAVLWLS